MIVCAVLPVRKADKYKVVDGKGKCQVATNAMLLCFVEIILWVVDGNQRSELIINPL